MTASALERARHALRRGEPRALLGERESVWLDVKSGIYRLDQPMGREELAKDVAAFANTSDGGLLLVGFSTKMEHGEEIVDALKPIPRRLVDLDRHRQTIQTRVIPALRNVSVDWIECGNALGVLVIDIPAQPRSSQLFAVPAPTRTTEVSKTAVGVPVRRGDATSWLQPHDIQRLIGLGWANSGDGIDKLLATIQTQQRVEPKHTVGGGEPGWSGVFQQAANDLAERGVRLGDPVSDVSPVGPGVTQHFKVRGEQFGWVLCAQPKHRPVAVAEEIWTALREQGSGSPGGDAPGTLGFPAGDPTKTVVVDRYATVVRLSGGSWGRGRLLREPGVEGRGWWWEPDPLPSTTMSASTRNWTSSAVPAQLRARVLAILPWAGVNDLKITPNRLAAVIPELPFSRLAGFTTNLSGRRGGELHASAWTMGPNGNASDRLSYASEITASDGERVLAAEVMMSLPGTMGSAVVTCAEVRIESFDVWARALGSDPTAGLRWSGDDLFEFFVAAWETASELLPRLVLEDATTRGGWSAVPRVELWVGTDQQHNQSGAQLLLEDVLDVAPFGPSGHRGQLSELFVSLPTVPGLDAETRRSRARSVLVDMAHRYGFMQARESNF